VKVRYVIFNVFVSIMLYMVLFYRMDILGYPPVIVVALPLVIVYALRSIDKNIGPVEAIISRDHLVITKDNEVVEFKDVRDFTFKYFNLKQFRFYPHIIFNMTDGSENVVHFSRAHLEVLKDVLLKDKYV
jgi:hypothetical protein